MTKQLSILAGLTLLLGFSGVALGGDKESEPFERATVRFEQNATDEDVEVVFEVTSGDNGLAKLIITAPDGRTVVNFKAPDASTLGIRSFHFESPEPTDAATLKPAYPEGVYTFAAVTAAGDKLLGNAKLNHKLPTTATFMQPAPDADDVEIEDLEISWSLVEGLSHYIVEIEQDELDVNLTTQLPATVTKFAVPDGFLRPDTEYKLAIGTVTEDGNISFVEMSFTTAE